MIKKFIKTLFVILILFIISNIPVSGQEEPTLVKIGVYDNKPKIYIDEEGEVKGLYGDVVKYVAQQEGWEIEYVYGTWSECLERLENNEIDVMVDVAISEERRDMYDFNSETVLVNWASLYTREGLTIQSFSELEGKRIAVMKSGIHYNGPLGIKNLVDSFGINVEFIDVDVYSDVFKFLNENRADAGVVNRVFGITNESDYNVLRSNIVFNPIELRFAFPKDSEKNDYLIQSFDKHLRSLKADSNSIYYESLKNYLPGFTVQLEQEIPAWFFFILIALIIVLFGLTLVIILSRHYEKQLESNVKDRTLELQKTKDKYAKLYEDSQKKISEMEILMKSAVDRELKMKDMKTKLENFS